jgi:endonuclease YncB( thermonuclease family)
MGICLTFLKWIYPSKFNPPKHHATRPAAIVPPLPSHISSSEQNIQHEDSPPSPSSPFAERKDVDAKRDIRDVLRSRSFRNLPLYSLQNRKLYGKVVHVVDGDTVHLIVFINHEAQKHAFRLFGIDTPEKKPRLTIPNRPLHVRAAKIAQAKLSQFLFRFESLVWVEFHEHEKDKYGRAIGEMFVEPDALKYGEQTIDQEVAREALSPSRISVNKLMLTAKLAKPYAGKAKQVWEKLDLDFIVTNEAKELIEELEI